VADAPRSHPGGRPGDDKCDVYLLWGEKDPFGPADAARSFAARIPNATLELMPNAGHAVWLDDPDRAAELLMTFLGTDVKQE
jgi:pimeloyl-ACP methyl ester carboxylesterase